MIITRLYFRKTSKMRTFQAFCFHYFFHLYWINQKYSHHFFKCFLSGIYPPISPELPPEMRKNIWVFSKDESIWIVWFRSGCYVLMYQFYNKMIYFYQIISSIEFYSELLIYFKIFGPPKIWIWLSNVNPPFSVNTLAVRASSKLLTAVTMANFVHLSWFFHTK